MRECTEDSRTNDESGGEPIRSCEAKARLGATTDAGLVIFKLSQNLYRASIMSWTLRSVIGVDFQIPPRRRDCSPLLLAASRGHAEARGRLLDLRAL